MTSHLLDAGTALTQSFKPVNKSERGRSWAVETSWVWEAGLGDLFVPWVVLGGGVEGQGVPRCTGFFEGSLRRR